MKNVLNIGIMGASLSTGNMGVSALANSVIKIILNISPHVNVALLIGNKSNTPQKMLFQDKQLDIRIINFRLSPRAKLSEHLIWIFFLSFLYKIIPVKKVRNIIINSNPWLYYIYNTHFIGEICGGDSFSDIYGLRRFILTILPDIIVLNLGKSLVLLPQTYGPYKSGISKSIAKLILKNAKLILSRDLKGIHIVEEILGKNYTKDKLKFCPDVAFMLDSHIPTNPDISPAILPEWEQDIIGINVNGLLYNGGYTRDNMFNLKLDYKDFINKLILELLIKTKSHILLIPHTFGLPGNINSDPDASRVVFEAIEKKYSDRVHMLMRQYDQIEIKGIIGKSSFFIGSRMHACIAALSQNICTVGVAYSRKFIGVFNSIGMEDLVIDARASETTDALSRILNIYETKESYTIQLAENVSTAQRTINETFKSLIYK